MFLYLVSTEIKLLTEFVVTGNQEVLQVYIDAELRGVEHPRQFVTGFTSQHYDGPQEVLQSSVSLSHRCRSQYITVCSVPKIL